MTLRIQPEHQHYLVDKFMNEEIAEYEIGKRHLANIMGEDVDNFHQEDIDVGTRLLSIYIHLLFVHMELYYLILYTLEGPRILIVSDI